MTFRASAPKHQDVAPKTLLGRPKEEVSPDPAPASAGETPVETPPVDTPPKLELVPPPEGAMTHTATTIAGIKEWVGENKERAQTALDDEMSSDHPRSTLLTWLNGVIDG